LSPPTFAANRAQISALGGLGVDRDGKALHAEAGHGFALAVRDAQFPKT